MLKNYLNTVPHTKFILIEDEFVSRDPRIFEHIVRQHLNRNQHRIQYFVFEGIFKRTENKYQNYSNIVLHDFVTDSKNWLDDGKDNNSFENAVLKLGENDILIVDSLSTAILLYGIPQTYRIFNGLRNSKAIQQIIVVIHKDLIEGDYYKVCRYFDNLSTMTIVITPKFRTEKRRMEYRYKKSGGKVLTQIEEYKFEGENFLTNEIEKPDPKKFMEEAVSKDINPEQLSTFRIGLTDEEKLSREKVVLPYLPAANEKKNQEEGKIFYQLDDVDDWDEEDPDDDLDI